MELDRVKREVQNLQKHLREEESQAEVFKRETEEIARELETQRSRFLEISRQIREAERAVYEASQAASKRGEAILQDLREKRVHLTEELSLMKKSKDTQTHACKRGERLHTFLRNRISVYHKKEEIEREREKIRHLEDTLKEELKGKTFQKRRESDQKEDEKQTKKEEDEEEEEEQEEEEESVNDRVRRLRSECQRAKEKKARLEGSLQTRVERVKEIQKELKSSAVYRHVEEKYQSALVDAETELMAVKDLDRYHKALDKALMKYHSMK
ncbi:smc n terminal domain-containing protein, partial [Cystoisospora suis]